MSDQFLFGVEVVINGLMAGVLYVLVQWSRNGQIEDSIWGCPSGC